jgi:hypothetical protein
VRHALRYGENYFVMANIEALMANIASPYGENCFVMADIVWVVEKVWREVLQITM